MGALLAGTAMGLPTAEELLAKMTEKVNQVKSFEAQMKVTTETPGHKDTDTAHMAMEKAEVGGKQVERILIAAKITKVRADGKEETGEEMIVNDGVFVWGQRRARGSETIKVRKDAAETMGVGWWAKEMNGMNRQRWGRFELAVVGEDVIEGQKMYVLEGKAKEAQPGQPGPERRRKIWVGQEDLLVHRDVTTTAGEDPAKRRVETLEFSEIKVDQKVDPALFKYTPPAGVEVEDRTAGK